MNLILELKIAIKNLKKHFLRTILSISGITIGITTIIIILSIGGAIEHLILGQLDNIGSDNLFVEVKVPTGKNETKNAMAFAQGVTITTLKREDTEEVEKLPNVDFAYSATTGQSVITYRNEEKKITYWATTPEIPVINGFEVEKGRFFTEEEDKSVGRVVVLGYSVAEELFDREDPIGKNVKIDKINFKVIGVAEERGIEMFTNVDDMVYIPLKTAQKLLLGVDHILFMGIKMKSEDLLNSTVANIQSVIRQRHQITDPEKDDFAVRTLDEASEILGTVTFGIQALLFVVGAISLIVGGVGIMNIMYVSVSERTHEIGLLKAIGAKNNTILKQFILEAFIITFLGGVLGIAFGAGFSYLIALGARGQGLDWAYIITIKSILFATLTSGFIGLVFGYYPAKKASQLEAIEALRWE